MEHNIKEPDRLGPDSFLPCAECGQNAVYETACEEVPYINLECYECDAIICPQCADAHECHGA